MGCPPPMGGRAGELCSEPGLEPLLPIAEEGGWRREGGGGGEEEEAWTGPQVGGLRELRRELLAPLARSAPQGCSSHLSAPATTTTTQ
jgi:hypothetical protein